MNSVLPVSVNRAGFWPGCNSNPSPKNISSPSTTSTAVTSCSTGTIAKYKWDFGDGETSAEHKPSHTFENPGSYEISLEVADAQNVVDATTEFITVTGELTRQ